MFGLDTHVSRVTSWWDELPRKQRISAGVILVALLAVFPLLTDQQFVLNMFIFIFLYATMGHAWNIIGGYTGQVSLGHAIFFAFGAYTTAVLFVYYGVTPLIGIWIGALVATGAGLLLGAATFKLRYHYFAMATLAAALIVSVVFKRWKFVGGSTGISYPLAQLNTLYSFTFGGKLQYYYITGVVALCVTLLMYRLDRSKLGIYLKAISMDEEAARNTGINTYLYKLYAMGLSAFITGITGGLYAQYILYIDPPSTLSVLRNIDMIMVAIIGGVGTVFGPIVGALVFVPVREYTRTALSGSATGLGWVIFGFVLLAISLYRPGGILNKYTGGWNK